MTLYNLNEIFDKKAKILKIQEGLEKNKNFSSYFSEEKNFNGFYVNLDNENFYLKINNKKKSDKMRNLLIIEENSKCTIFLKLVGNSEIDLFNLIYLKRKSKCNLIFLQNLNNTGKIFNKFITEDGSELNLFNVNFGTFTKKFFSEIDLKRNSNFKIFDLFFCSNGEMEIHSKVFCNHENNKGLILAKGITKGKNKFNGYAKINKNAYNSDLFIKGSVLVLDKGKSEITPVLEIENNQVKAGHSAVIEQIDEEKLFYLETRGINKNEAKFLLIKGFLLSMMKKIKIKDIRKEINFLFKKHFKNVEKNM